MKLVIVLGILLFLTMSIFSQKTPSEVVTVLDFETSDVSEAEAKVFTDFLTSYVVAIGHYRVIDRSQRDRILDELRFSLSDCTDEKCQLEVGKLLSANLIIVGSLGKVGDRFILNTRLIAVETGEALRTASEKYSSMGDLIDGCEQVVEQLLRVDDTADRNAVARKEEPKPEATEGERSLSSPGSVSSDDQITRAGEIDVAQRISSLENKLTELNISLENKHKIGKSINTTSLISLSSGVVSLIGMGISYFLGRDAMNQYDNAIDINEAEEYRQKTMPYVVSFNITGVLSGLGICLSTIGWLIRPDIAPIQEEIEFTERELLLLRSTDK
jgi:hypothetical protein